jgi:response regulator of citrate/malate metabolism
MKYNKITKDQLFRFMIDNRLTADFYEILFSAKKISKYMNTSVYQARKYLRELSNEGKIKYECQIHHDYGEYGVIEETYPPICGYRVKEEFIDRNNK